MLWLIFFLWYGFVGLCVIVFLWQRLVVGLKWACAKIDAMPSAMDPQPVKRRIEPTFDRTRK